jgi:8-oxo-dGTP pyrophosphatase MutT (NUDIX family)
MKIILLAGCVILQGKDILLLHRRATDWYELPGGKVYQGEELAAAAQRELKEELGVDVRIMRKLGTKDFMGNGNQLVYTWFLATIEYNQQPIIKEANKFDGYKYINLETLNTIKLSHNMHNLVQALDDKSIILA